MSFRAQKIRFLVDFSFASRYFGLSNLCWVEWFLLGVNTAHSFSTTRRHLRRKPHLIRRLVNFSFALWSSSSTFNCGLRLLFTVKRNCSVFIHDLERVNEFLRLNSHVKFLSNKVEVAGGLCLSRKIPKRDRNCHLYIINK